MVEYLAKKQYVGRQFGNYRLQQFLGVHKSASLFLGQHVHLQTQAVVKLYEAHLRQNDQQGFLTEARIIAHLVHPHILRVLEFGVEDDIPFLIAAYAPGGALRQRYPPTTLLPLPMVSSYASQIAGALDYAHSQRVLHLDVRPENMWFKRDHEVFLSDFRPTLFSTNSRSESLMEIAEAVAYMAPEQIQGRACPSSDQYALGIVVYEWLCGSRPFIGTNYLEMAQQHLQEVPPPLSKRNPGISMAVEQVVMRVLAKDPAERFPSVLAFANALGQGTLGSGNSLQDLLPVVDSLPPLPLPALDASSGLSKGGHARRTITLGLVGLAGVAAVGGAITWFVRSSPKAKALPPVTPTISPKPANPGTTLYTYRGHTDVVYAVAWSRDGKNLASWARDDTMQIWNARTYSAVQTYPMTGIASWSPDWRLMASGSFLGFEVWELATGRIIFGHDFGYTGAGAPPYIPVNSLIQWSPDGGSVVSTSDATLIWETSTGKTLFSYPPGSVTWSSDGKRLAYQKIDYTSQTPYEVQIIDVATENQLASYKIDDTGILWSPDGKYLVSSNGSIWDARNGKFVVRYKGNAKPGNSIWSPNSQHLALFDDSEYVGLVYNQARSITADPTVRIWSATTGEEILVYRAHTAGVNYVAWSPDSTKIASASTDMTVKVWQAVTT